KRGDQRKPALLYTEAQLQLRRAEIALHPTRHDTAGAVAATLAAVASARTEYGLATTDNNLAWLGSMLDRSVDAMRLQRRWSEAQAASDTATAVWSQLLNHARRKADTSDMVDAHSGIIRELMSRAFVSIQQDHNETGVRQAREAVDSGGVLV